MPWLGAAPPARWAWGSSPPRERATKLASGCCALQLQCDVDHRQAGADQQHRAWRDGVRVRRGARDRSRSARDPRARRPRPGAGSRGGRLPSARTARPACRVEPSANRSRQPAGRAADRRRPRPDGAPASARAGRGLALAEQRLRGRRRRRAGRRTSSSSAAGVVRAGARSAGSARGRRAGRSGSRRAR